jgi:putative tricarboxylic transport membrane protein
MDAERLSRPPERQGAGLIGPAPLFGAVVIGGAAALFAVALSIPIRPNDPLLGPRLFPLAITGALCVLGIIYLVSMLLSRAAAASLPEDQGPVRWSAVGLIAAGLVLFGILVEPAGFVLAETALFVCVARAFGSRRVAVDVGIGFALSIAIYVLFAFGLGLQLSGGVFSHLNGLWS